MEEACPAIMKRGSAGCVSCTERQREAFLDESELGELKGSALPLICLPRENRSTKARVIPTGSRTQDSGVRSQESGVRNHQLSTISYQLPLSYQPSANNFPSAITFLSASNSGGYPTQSDSIRLNPTQSNQKNHQPLCRNLATTLYKGLPIPSFIVILRTLTLTDSP